MVVDNKQKLGRVSSLAPAKADVGADQQIEQKFPLAPMGVLATGLHTRAQPPSTPAEMFCRTCLQSHLQTSPQPLRSRIRNSRTTFGRG
jgi:hypothetical protein